MIDCIVKLAKSKENKMAVITSIHQPNNDIMLKFDKIYVLTLGGICVYNDSPQKLHKFLEGSQDNLNPNLIPIEQLIKICAQLNKESQDKAKVLIKKSNVYHKKSIETCKSEGRIVRQFEQRKTVFIPLHILYLLARSFKIFKNSGKLELFLHMFVIIFVFGIVIPSLFTGDIGAPDGCIAHGPNQTISQNKQSMIEANDLANNQKLIFFAQMVLQLCITVPTASFYTKDTKIFLSEHRNGIIH